MEQSIKFIIHYDLLEGKHYIPIEQSIITEQSINTIIRNLSNNLYNWDFDLKIFTEAEDEWGVIKKFIIWTVLWTTAIVANTLLESLTWKDYSWNVENITIQLKDATIAFLSEPSFDLVEKWLCKEDYYDAYEAKNILYKSAISNSDVSWIWFCEKHNFPIERNSFIYKTIELKKEKTWDKFIDKYHDLIVVSSINSEKDKKLKWHVKDKITEERFWVDILDDDFYTIYFSSTLMVKEFKVRVRYYINVDNFWEETITNQSIVMVYEYNNTYKLMTLPNDFKIETAPYKFPENYKEITNQTNLII